MHHTFDPPPVNNYRTPDASPVNKTRGERRHGETETPSLPMFASGIGDSPFHLGFRDVGLSSDAEPSSTDSTPAAKRRESAPTARQSPNVGDVLGASPEPDVVERLNAVDHRLRHTEAEQQQGTEEEEDQRATVDRAVDDAGRRLDELRVILDTIPQSLKDLKSKIHDTQEKFKSETRDTEQKYNKELEGLRAEVAERKQQKKNTEQKIAEAERDLRQAKEEKAKQVARSRLEQELATLEQAKHETKAASTNAERELRDLQRAVALLQELKTLNENTDFCESHLEEKNKRMKETERSIGRFQVEIKSIDAERDDLVAEFEAKYGKYVSPRGVADIVTTPMHPADLSLVSQSYGGSAATSRGVSPVPHAFDDATEQSNDTTDQEQVKKKLRFHEEELDPVAKLAAEEAESAALAAEIQAAELRGRRNNPKRKAKANLCFKETEEDVVATEEESPAPEEESPAPKIDRERAATEQQEEIRNIVHRYFTEHETHFPDEMYEKNKADFDRLKVSKEDAPFELKACLDKIRDRCGGNVFETVYETWELHLIFDEAQRLRQSRIDAPEKDQSDNAKMLAKHVAKNAPPDINNPRDIAMTYDLDFAKGPRRGFAMISGRTTTLTSAQAHCVLCNEPIKRNGVGTAYTQFPECPHKYHVGCAGALCAFTKEEYPVKCNHFYMGDSNGHGGSRKKSESEGTRSRKKKATSA